MLLLRDFTFEDGIDWNAFMVMVFDELWEAEPESLRTAECLRAVLSTA